jgi:solute carrier family 25 (mitochondrial folate transporter), member 32
LHSVSLASFEAGVFASVVTQPFWVIKTRMLLNVRPRTGEFRNFFEKAREIYGQYGVRGYMKGLSLNLWLSLLGISQMFFYEGSKLAYDALAIPETALSEKSFICGGISKVCSGLILYPLTTVRTRIQQNQFIQGRTDEKYRGVGQIISRTFHQEGISGFYKGLTPNILKGIPQRGLYFYFYEILKQALAVEEAQKQE